MKKLTLFLLFLFVSCPCFALTIIDDDVLYDEVNGLKWYRHIFDFAGMTYFEIEDAVQELAKSSDYDWKIATLEETYAMFSATNGYYNFDPSIFFYQDTSINYWTTMSAAVEIQWWESDGILNGLVETPEVHIDYRRINFELDRWEWFGIEGLEYVMPGCYPLDTTFRGAWVVAEGNAPVPEPMTISLFLTGLAFVGYRSRKKGSVAKIKK